MMLVMSQEERTRVVCCWKPCSICHAARGEYCHNRAGDIWKKAYHAGRGPQGSKEYWAANKHRYAALTAQVRVAQAAANENIIRRITIMIDPQQRTRNAVALVNILVLAMVDDADAVSVSPQEDEAQTTIHVHVAPGDLGKLIGKHGRNARSLRTIVAAHGMKVGRRISLNIVETAKTPIALRRGFDEDEEVHPDTDSLEDRGMTLGSYGS